VNLNLPVEANDFVRSLVEQGKYQSEEAAVIDGLRLLMGREGLERGESFNEDAVFAEVEAEIRDVESPGAGA
jgi:antitoxin ParD1/3/4